MSENRKKWEQKIQEIQKNEEMKSIEKQQKLDEKDKVIEQHIEKCKYWNSQSGLYVTELNNLKKSDQELNLLKEKELKKKMKEKILNEHRRKSLLIEQIKEDQRRVMKFKSEVDNEILNKRNNVKACIENKSSQIIAKTLEQG